MRIYLAPAQQYIPVEDFFPPPPHTPYHPWIVVRERLKERGIELIGAPLDQVPSDADIVFIVNLAQNEHSVEQLQRFKKEQLVLMQWEPPVVDAWPHEAKTLAYFGKVLMLSKRPDADLFVYPQRPDIRATKIPFAYKGVAAIVNGCKRSSHPLELYSEREKVIAAFEKKHSPNYRFYGHGWDGQKYKSYGGAPDHKLSVLSRFRFSFAYENTRDLPGYITEKIFHGLMARTVPIYLGAPDIADYVPPECFINRRDYSTLESLFDHIEAMGEAEHERYLEAGLAFLDSPEIERFSLPYFINWMSDYLETIACTKAPA